VTSQFLSHPGTRFAERSYYSFIDNSPLGHCAVPFEFRPESFCLFASLRQALAYVWLFYQFFDRAKPLIPIAEAASGKRRITTWAAREFS